MSTYYCHTCAIQLRELIPAMPFNLTGTQYQLEKYIKHTAPTTSYDFNSIFTGAASATYFNAIVSTVASGHFQIDDWGRKNLVLVASGSNGFMYQNGSLVGSTDAVKVVYVYDTKKMHGFPIHTDELRNGICEKCGRPIIL